MSSPDNELNQYLNRIADEEEREERIDALAAAYAQDPKRRAEADEYMDGQLPEWFYRNIEGLLADVHSILTDITVSAPHESLRLLAERCAEAAKTRAEKIRDLAERDTP